MLPALIALSLVSASMIVRTALAVPASKGSAKHTAKELSQPEAILTDRQMGHPHQVDKQAQSRQLSKRFHPQQLHTFSTNMHTLNRGTPQMHRATD